MNEAIILYGYFGDIACISALSNYISANFSKKYSIITTEPFISFCSVYGSFENIICFSENNITDFISKINSLNIDVIYDLHNKSYSEHIYIEWLENVCVDNIFIPEDRAKLLKERNDNIKIVGKRIYTHSHNADYYLKRIGLNINLEVNSLRIIPIIEDVDFANSFKKSYPKEFLIGIVPNSRFKHKELNIDKWVELRSLLKDKSIKFWILCADFEINKVRELANEINAEIIAVNQIEDYFKYILCTNLVISVDTGIKHLAGYIGHPVISLYGHTTPSIWGTFSDSEFPIQGYSNCRPCNNPFRCIEGGNCINNISVKEIQNVINKLLDL